MNNYSSDKIYNINDKDCSLYYTNTYYTNKKSVVPPTSNTVQSPFKPFSISWLMCTTINED